MKTALVTGAYGFVGRHLIPRLIEYGYEKIIAIDTHCPAPAEFANFPQVMRYSGVDAALLGSGNWLDEARLKFDLVVHLAANIRNVNQRMNEGIQAYSDIALDYAVCQWVEKAKPACFVAMSSCAVDYPADPYCIVKQNLEVFARALQKQGQRTIILRPFSGYGHDQSDEYPFPSIMKRAHKRQDPLVVWGGLQKRDWLHIDDLVDGIVFAVNNFPSDFGPVELGTGEAVSFYDFAKLMAIHGPGYSPAVQGDLSKAASSSERRAGMSGATMAQEFGWTPKVSLTEGIRLEYKKFLSMQSK